MHHGLLDGTGGDSTVQLWNVRSADMHERYDVV
jgi:hypothetical protein